MMMVSEVLWALSSISRGMSWNQLLIYKYLEVTLDFICVYIALSKGSDYSPRKLVM